MTNLNKIFSGAIDHVWSTNVGALKFPEEKGAEVAFIGRSNVGKSSLINAFCGRKKLARTSNTPGATRGAHFYHVKGGGDATSGFTVVDLPGYGFAKMSKQLSAQVAELVNGYLERRSLKCVYVLLDARHGVKKVDELMLKELANMGISHKVVFTKMDKVPPRLREKAQAELTETTQEAFPMLRDGILFTSSSKGWGIEELRLDVLSACEVK